jgi:hypothetical protein
VRSGYRAKGLRCRSAAHFGIEASNQRVTIVGRMDIGEVEALLIDLVQINSINPGLVSTGVGGASRNPLHVAPNAPIVRALTLAGAGHRLTPTPQ